MWCRTTTGGINLHTELEKPKPDQITERNIRMSLDKRIATASLEENRTRPKYDIRVENLPNALQTVLIAAGPGFR